MNTQYLIIGLGKTGLSCLHYCLKQGWSVAVTDSRENPPGKDEFLKIAPHVPHVFGEISAELINQAENLIVSPGVSLKESVISAAIEKGKSFLGDVELFVQAVKGKSIIGITGSNAKSTVTSLLGKIAAAAGVKAKVVGNIGAPALDAIDATVELYIMELSSFQLETTHYLPLIAATILNICEDHMDRYDSLKDYIAAKQRIYSHAKIAVFNRADQFTIDQCHDSRNKSFGQDAPKNKNEYGLKSKDNRAYLACGDELLLPVNEMHLHGKHDIINALAALALSDAYGIPRKIALDQVKLFNGLPHRCQLISKGNGIGWYNDSKATNVGATIAALEGLGKNKNLILIAGGVGKGADFSLLRPAVEKHVSSLLLIGEAADEIEKICQDCVPIKRFSTLGHAAEYAKSIAKPGENVLLSPACASFDMFDNFEHRGEVFTHLIKNHERKS